MDAVASGAIIARTNDAMADGEIVWSWRSDAGAKFVKTLTRLADDGGNQAWSPGRSRISRKTIAQGRPDDRPHLWFCRVLFCCTRTMGASWHPAFPAPSSVARAKRKQKLGRHLRRENVEVCRCRCSRCHGGRCHGDGRNLVSNPG